VTDSFKIRQWPNGLTVLGQPMAHVSSAAMMLSVRCGVAHDPPGGEGVAAVASEWVLRGAGPRNSRQLNDAFDALGCQHSHSAHSEQMSFSAVQLGRNLPDVLDLCADILRAPQLEADSFGACRDLIAQDLQSLEDDPAHKCTALLREKFFPYPLGRISYGTHESLGNMTAELVRRHVQTHFSPRDAILAAAGQFDWDRLCDRVERRLGDWEGLSVDPPAVRTAEADSTHVAKDTSQTHIALAYAAAPCRDDDYYPARIVEAILSFGMGSRLFTEVREKRGLAYHVSASYVSLLRHAGLFVYAGTRPDLARQSFEVILSELRRLPESIEEEELRRAKTQIRSALIMQGASTSSRAGALVSDWRHLGRLQTLEDVSQKVQAVTREDVLAYLRKYPAENFTILTIGPEGVTDSAGGAEEKA
jgi:predicted Zn-dependent peptidase